MILGLTGSIAMGKSTVAAMFRDLGVPVFDADAVVHKLQGPEGALVGVIGAAFPGTAGAWGIDRQHLAARVFGDAAALARLEAIVHPAVAEERAAFLAAHRTAQLIVLNVPLLFERGGDGQVDATVVVSASAAAQRHRVLARPGMTAARFAAIAALQMPDAEKRSRATYIIDTGGTIAETSRQVADLVACLTASERR